MQTHKIAALKETPRERVEKSLVSKIASIKPFEPLVDHQIVDGFKDGTYGMSSAAFALYSNGHNLRGKSSFAPFGLLYHDGEHIFSVGYFKREGEPADKPGYLIIVSPRGLGVEERVDDFAKQVIRSGIEVSGFYIRYLRLDQFIKFLNINGNLTQHSYYPVKVQPWHPEAPEEDESLSNGIVNLRKIISNDKTIQNLDAAGNKNHRRNFRLHANRFTHFLERTGLSYSLRELTCEDKTAASEIIKSHFDMLKRMGKDIGSTAEDHANSLSEELLSLESVGAKIGFLGGVPVSLFVYEKLGDSSVGLYTTFTLRDKELILPRLGLGQSDLTGFSAMPMYAYAKVFAELMDGGIEIVHLGGSEHPDLNLIKRHMGGVSDPTFWVVRLLNR